MFKKKKEKKNELKSHHSCRVINIYGSKKRTDGEFFMFDFLVQYKGNVNKSNDLLKDDRGGKRRTSWGSSRGIKNNHAWWQKQKKNPPAAPAESVWAADCASLVTSRIFNLRVMLRSVGLSLFVAARWVLPGILLINYRHQEKKSNSSQILKSIELKKQSGPLLNPTANGVK